MDIHEGVNIVGIGALALFLGKRAFLDRRGLTVRETGLTASLALAPMLFNITGR